MFQLTPSATAVESIQYDLSLIHISDKDGGHREQNKTNENGRLSVVTTIFPPYDFVREIAGDLSLIHI